MKKRVYVAALGVLSAVLTVQASDKVVGASAAEERVIRSWSGRAGLEAWSKGFLSGVADPRFEKDDLVFDVKRVSAAVRLSLAEPIEVCPDMAVRLTLWTSKKGLAEFGWNGQSLQGQPCSWGERFNLRDGGYQTYWLFPAWSNPRDGGSPVVRRLTRLSLNFPYSMASGRVGIRDVSLVRVGTKPLKASEADGIVFTLADDRVNYYSLRWHASSGDWKKSDVRATRIRFSTMQDGIPHKYWINLKDALSGVNKGSRVWTGEIGGLTFADCLRHELFMPADWTFVKGVPDLPPDPALRAVQTWDAIPRAGRPLPIEVVVRNLGTRPVENIRFSFEGLPEGVRVACAAELAPPGTIAPSKGYGEIGNSAMPEGIPNDRRFRITLTDPGRALDSTAKLVMTADGGVRRERTFDLKVLPSLGLAPCTYPPEPKPVDTGDVKVGALVFPGWHVHQWYPVWNCTPHRKPVMGWYDDASVEVRDWQIKHLVENGFSYVIVDWYWNRSNGYNSETGSRNLALTYWEESFRKAKYRKYLKWALMWCCESRNMHSEEDMRNVTKYWIDHYFADGQYLKIDGRPVVAIYRPENMTEDLGPGGTRRLLDLSRAMIKAAGYPDVYFTGSRCDREDRSYFEDFREKGLDATFVYKYTTLWCKRYGGIENGTLDYRHVVETSLDHWREVRRVSCLPFWPSLSTGWGNMPWLGDEGWEIGNIWPSSFAQICRDARSFADESGQKYFLMGPLDEWAEGEIGWPNKENGFGMFEAVRDAFGRKPKDGWPLNYTPEDVGLGPYTYEPAVLQEDRRK